ncbi:transposase, IS605 OrfB family protein, partial [Halococcus thailandensis JCM 13552]
MSRYDELGVLPDLKKWWDDLGDVYSRTLQNVVERLYDNLEILRRLKKEGHRVGHLRWTLLPSLVKQSRRNYSIPPYASGCAPTDSFRRDAPR